MVLKNTSLRIEEQYMKKLKLLAVKKEITQSELLNEFIKQGLIKNGCNIE